MQLGIVAFLKPKQTQWNCVIVSNFMKHLLFYKTYNSIWWQRNLKMCNPVMIVKKLLHSVLSSHRYSIVAMWISTWPWVTALSYLKKTCLRASGSS
jgi:hypothetical protein